MDELCTYQIKVRGQVEAAELNAVSPFQITAVRAGQAATFLVVRTDQSGLVGLIRHLHSWGCLLLSITRPESGLLQEE